MNLAKGHIGRNGNDKRQETGLHGMRLARMTDEQNHRRCQLIDKKIDASLTQEEQQELDALQEIAWKYRQSVAPLPIEELKAFHAALIKEVGP